MAWNRIDPSCTPSNKAIIYRASRTRSGITFEATDLSRVWVEALNDDEVLKRATELNSIIALDSRQDITELFGLLQSVLHTPTNFDSDGTLELSYTLNLDQSIQQKWFFKCQELSAENARNFLGSIVHELFEVISDLNAELVAEKRTSKQLRYHIRNLSRHCAKEDPYKPHRFQESYQHVMEGQESVEDTFASSDVAVSSDNIPGSPPEYGNEARYKGTKWQNGLSVSGRFHVERYDVKEHDNVQSDADTTIISAEVGGKPFNPDVPFSPRPAATQASPQTLSQVSQDSPALRETAEELRQKLQRQRASKNKRRRF